MASALEMKEAEDDYQRLQRAVMAYLSECDNPVPDYGYRRTLRNELRRMTGAPAEPPPRTAGDPSRLRRTRSPVYQVWDHESLPGGPRYPRFWAITTTSASATTPSPRQPPS